MVFIFHETFPPVGKPFTIKNILTIALSHGWKLFQIDLNNAFLNDYLDETIYMQQPPSFEASDKALVCMLKTELLWIKTSPEAVVQSIIYKLLFISLVLLTTLVTPLSSST